MSFLKIWPSVFVFLAQGLVVAEVATIAATDSGGGGQASLEEVKALGALRSTYLNKGEAVGVVEEPKAGLDAFQKVIEPILLDSCAQCHGPKKQKARFRVDTLDPDLVHGEDADWWLEVMEVMSNGEMPPPEDVEMAAGDRAQVIDWLSEQILVASQVKRSSAEHSSFRRLTRYEFSYALQDLLKLSQDFSANLPPETVSEDGFKNSSEMLQMTSQQFGVYREVAREALQLATVREEQPEPTYLAFTMEKAGAGYMEWVNEYLEFYERQKKLAENDSDIPGRFKKAKEQAERNELLRDEVYFLNQETGEAWNRSFPNGFLPWTPTREQPVDPERQSFVMVLPHGEKQKIDLGNSLPERGSVRVRFRASRAQDEGESYPSLSLSFGYNPNNNSRHEYGISQQDIAITAGPDEPQFYEWVVELDRSQRNP